MTFAEFATHQRRQLNLTSSDRLADIGRLHEVPGPTGGKVVRLGGKSFQWWASADCFLCETGCVIGIHHQICAWLAPADAKRRGKTGLRGQAAVARGRASEAWVPGIGALSADAPGHRGKTSELGSAKQPCHRHNRRHTTTSFPASQTDRCLEGGR